MAAAPDGPLGVAVSGGGDSIALLHLAREWGARPLFAVTIDHGLRKGSDAEAIGVGLACRGLDIHHTTIEWGGWDGKGNLQDRARHARRRLIAEWAREKSIAAVLLGHTADDQAETLLINLLRGAGVNGLSAMAPGPRHPILSLRRSETVSLCQHSGLDPVQDPSNRDPRFVRNRVRQELLPLLADIGRRDPVPLLTRTAERAREVRRELAGLAADVDPTDTRAAAAHPASVYREALRAWLVDDRGHPPSAAELERALAVVRHEVVACELSGGRRLARRDGTLRLE